MIGKEFSLKYDFKNLLELNGGLSPEEIHFGVPWCLSASKKDDHLAIYLRCEKPKDEKNLWSVDVDYTFSITSGTENEKPTHTISHTFHEQEGYGTRDLATWDDVITKYMTDNSVSIECRVTIKNMIGFSPKKAVDFDGMSEHLTDVVLKVQEVKFNVLKPLLAFHSPYFEKLFFGDFSESKDSEIELKDLDPNDFQSLLDIIYAYATSAIQADNVEGLLKLADQFDVKLVLDLCGKFLLKNDTIDKKLKLRLADWYALKDLKKDCLESIRTLSDLEDSVPFSARKLSQETLEEILKKCIELAD